MHLISFPQNVTVTHFPWFLSLSLLPSYPFMLFFVILKQLVISMTVVLH